MAEAGGSGKNEGNPFSFRKFSKNQTREVSDGDNEANMVAMFAQPDILTADTKSIPTTQRICQERKQCQTQLQAQCGKYRVGKVGARKSTGKDGTATGSK